MKIIPAIDLYQGKCVRLHQGSFDDVTQYGDDPLMVARSYVEAGAQVIHIVDLDGAKNGKPQYLDTLLTIKENTALCIQTGGGLRDVNTIDGLIEKGIDRLVIGSMAVKQPELIEKIILKHGVDRIVLALDVQIKEEPFIAINGWQSTTTVSLWNLLDKYKVFSGLNILCTDIARDGALIGPNVALYKMCVDRYPGLCFQASGGVSQLSDLQQLDAVGVSAVVIGKALYEKKFTLSEALAEVENVN